MTSRFHLIVTVGLAMCLGIVGTLALSARNAIGYPAGAAVSVGTNPVVSAGGTIKWGEAAEALFTAPSDQDIVITDIVLSANSNRINCKAQAWVHLQSDSGSIGEFSLGTPVLYTAGWVTSGGQSNLVAELQSGLKLPAGETAQIVVTDEGLRYDCYTSDPDNVMVHYAISGYLAQP